MTRRCNCPAAAARIAVGLAVLLAGGVQAQDDDRQIVRNGSWPTAEEAARRGLDAAWTRYMEGMAADPARQHTEFGGWVYDDGRGGYGYTEPVEGDNDSVDPSWMVDEDPGGSLTLDDTGERVVGFYHTHPAEQRDSEGRSWDNERYSPDDRQHAEDLGIPYYLRTPGGKYLVYDPDDNDPSDGPNAWGRLPPLPTRPPDRDDGCSCSAAGASGDPHLTTFDGLGYSFQGIGDFLAARSLTGDFDIHLRFLPWGDSRQVSVLSAVGIRVAGRTLALRGDGYTTRAFIDGEPVDLQPGDDADLGDGLRLHFSPRRADVELAGHGRLIVRNFGDQLTLVAELHNRHFARTRGLFGDFDGDPGNDLAARDGTFVDGDADGGPLPKRIRFNRLYRHFGDSWRVPAAHSVLGSDGAVARAEWQTFPDADESAPSAEAQARAESLCAGANFASATARSNCEFDVAVTGETAFVAAAEFEERSRLALRRNGHYFTADLRSREQSSHAFAAAAGESWFIETRQLDRSLDLSNLALVGPDGNVVRRTCIRCNQLGLFRLTTPGVYRLTVEADPGESGRYGLMLHRVSRPQRFTIGRSQNAPSTAQREAGAGTIEAPGSTDVYLLPLEAGDRLQLQLNARDPTLYFAHWRLEAPDGSPVAERSLLPGPGSRSPALAIESAGEYRLVVDGGIDWPAADRYGSGDYDLEWYRAR